MPRIESHPPADTDAERAILGAVMIDGPAIEMVAGIIRPEAFYSEAHARIFQAMLNLNASGQPVDFVTLTQELDKTGHLDGVGGPAYITGLITATPTSVHAEYYAGIVAELSRRRRLIEIAGQMAVKAYRGDSSDVLQYAHRALTDIDAAGIGGLVHVKTVAGELYDKVERWSQNPLELGQVRGLATGIPHLDYSVGGLEPGWLVLVAGRPGMGKCLGYGTRVLMYDGSLKEVQDIEFGDVLMGPDSQPRHVLSTTRGFGEMFTVTQNSGISYNVNAEHVLSLRRSKTEGPHHHGDMLNIPVKEYITKGPGFKSRYKGYKVAVEFPSMPIPIEPYFLGLWLGDGHSHGARVTSCDQEVIRYLHEYADRLGMQVTQYHDDFGITSGHTGGTAEKKAKSLQGKMQAMALIPNKHIPYDYLVNDSATRLQLLAGLLDSDGHYLEPSNCYEITQKDRVLANQIKFLADSLGFRVRCSEKIAQIKDRDFRCLVYRLHISGNLNIIPCRIKRKQARACASTTEDHRHTGIKVAMGGWGYYYGFELDNDGLFLLEDMTVTHNSALAFDIARRVASRNEYVAIFSLEMPKADVLARWASSISGVGTRNIRRGVCPAKYRGGPYAEQYVTDEQLSRYMDALSAVSEMQHVWIDDSRALSASDIRARSMRQARRFGGLDLIVVDHTGRMKATGASGENTAKVEGRKSRELSDLAGELQCPVVLVQQLNREVGSRQNKQPTLTDLRDSGEHEENAHVILGLHRDSYYMPTLTSLDLDVLLLKHREGPAGSAVKLRYERHISRFSEYERQTK